MTNTLKNALPIVAAAYGDKFGVEVTIEGNSAYTDGNRIVIPAADPATHNYRDLVWGFLAHEAAHIRHTDFDVIARSANKPIRKAVLNIIEDVRIEQAIGQDYPGTRRTLHQLVRSLVESQRLSCPDITEEQPHPATLLQAWLLFRLRSRVLKQDALDPLFDQINKGIRQRLSAGFMARISALISSASQLQSTEEALQLTDALLALLEDEQKQEQPNQHQQESNTDASSTGDDKDSTNQTTDDNDNGISENIDQAPNSKRPDQADQTNEEDQTKNQTNVLKSALNQILSATDNDFSDDLQQLATSALENQVENASASKSDYFSSTSPFTLPTAGNALPGDSKLLSKVAAESGRLRARLQGLVQSSREQRSHYQQQGTRISPARLASSQTGNGKIFLKPHRRIAPNTAIYLLVDASGSMCRRGEDGIQIQQLANEAALALALAMEGIGGVSCGAGFFPGMESEIDSALSFGQSVRAKSSCFDQSPRGTTPMAEAIWYAASQLIYRKEERKIIMVITDGEPDELAQTLNIIGLCERSGIQLVGIGIQTDSVEQLFRSTSVIEDLGSLKSKLFELGKAAIG